jgi:hypothetical protein
MRTTLRIDEDVLRAARSLARAEGRTVGEVISDLARRALRPTPPGSRGRSGLPTFEVSQGAAPLTPEMVREALEDAG